MEQIVVGVDGSPESWLAVDLARELAAGTGAAVTAVHADHLSTRAVFGLGSSLGEEVEEEAELERLLTDELRGRNADGGPQVALELVKGKPAEVLLESVGRLGADLLVVGHAGVGGALSWMGSVANAVVHRAETSVVVAR